MMFFWTISAPIWGALFALFAYTVGRLITGWDTLCATIDETTPPY